jgi:hypothetical protein
MKRLGMCSSILVALAMATPAFAGGITFTCAASIGADFDPGGSSTAVCNYLNTVIAPEYNNTFSNANANVYIEATNGGLADSTTGFANLVTYSTYQTALESLSTDAAKAFVPASEPGIFGGDDVELTSALAEALGITKVIGGGSVLGTNAALTASCTNFATAGSGCYNGVIQVNDPTDLDTQTDGQGYDYRTLGGSTNGTADNYDFFGVVEHELDEILGTASCIGTTGADNTLTNPANCASAVDMFRYTSSGDRTFDTIGANAYFSANGGATDYEGNIYDNQANGDDWADFNNSCTFVQDGQGCPNGATFDILTDGPGDTAGPEVAILNAVGFNLDSASTPEPGTLALLGIGFTALGFIGRRRRQRRRSQPIEEIESTRLAGRASATALEEAKSR